MAQAIQLTVNQERKEIHTNPTDTLLYTLREKMGLTGTKPGCENGDCGACTIMVNQSPRKSCMMLTVEAVGQEVTTIEGLQNTPIQQAFMNRFAFQCGYCTSGFIMNCHALLQQHTNPDRYTIKNWLQSNLCRCTGYEEIQQAVEDTIQLKNEQIMKKQSHQ